MYIPGEIPVIDFAIDIAPSANIFLDKASCLKLIWLASLKKVTSWIPKTSNILLDSISTEVIYFLLLFDSINFFESYSYTEIINDRKDKFKNNLGSK